MIEGVRMTTGQMILMAGIYLVALVAVAYWARANRRRIAGALAGGAVFGVVALLAVALGEAQNWWRVPKALPVTVVTHRRRIRVRPFI
jgi:uncharacterized membrane protein YqjE